MRLTLLLIFTGVLFFHSHAQKKLTPGFIITLGQDTLTGYIDYRVWDKNPREVGFKRAMDDHLITYKPMDIYGFQVNDEIYTGARVETETSSDELDDLDISSELNLRTELVFLRALMLGDKSLYVARNQEGKVNFYIRNGDQFELLKYKRFLQVAKNAGEKQGVVENKIYLGQLIWYLDGCASLVEKIETTEYRENTLLRLFRDYYKCVEAGPFYEKEREKILSSGLLSGVSGGQISFGSGDFDYLVKADFNTSWKYSGGLFLEVFIPRSGKKWSFNNELLYTSYTTRGEYESGRTIYKTLLEYSYLKLHNMVRFKYIAGALQAYLNVGVSNGFAIHEKNKLVVQFSYAPDNPRTGMALEEVRTYEMGATAGTGVAFRDFSLELRYESGTGISDDSSTQRLYILTAYRF